jgi:hypothetical protein
MSGHRTALATFAALLEPHGLRLLPGSSAVPVDLLLQLPDASVAHFTARGTTLRLRVYPRDAMTTVLIAAECGCGENHPQVGPQRPVLRHDATPVAERSIDGRTAFGWRAHEAGLLRPEAAAPFLLQLVNSLAPNVVEPVAELAAVN